MSEEFETPKAVILVGGLGTRLRPLTDDVPKALMPLLNRPFLEHVIARLRWYGVREIVLAAHHMHDILKNSLGDGSDLGVKLVYSMEDEPLGTAGAVKNAARYLDGTFFVLNGDIFTDLNLDDMLESHYDNEAAATIAMHRVEDPSAYGVIETGEDGRVIRFVEKPPREEAASNWINAGTYILEPDLLDKIPSGFYMFETGLFPAILEEGETVYGYEDNSYWTDMGRPEHYLALCHDLLTGNTSSPLIDMPKSRLIRPVNGIDKSVLLNPPAIIGDGCRIGPGAALYGPVAMGNGCRLAGGARLENTVLWDDVSIGSGASISNCIIGSRVNIAPGQKLENTVVTVTESKTLSIII